MRAAAERIVNTRGAGERSEAAGALTKKRRERHCCRPRASLTSPHRQRCATGCGIGYFLSLVATASLAEAAAAGIRYSFSRGVSFSRSRTFTDSRSSI